VRDTTPNGVVHPIPTGRVVVPDASCVDFSTVHDSPLFVIFFPVIDISFFPARRPSFDTLKSEKISSDAKRRLFASLLPSFFFFCSCVDGGRV
jgi:hypothetical protein